jgi:hypothetical protein
VTPPFIVVSGYAEKPGRGQAWFARVWERNLRQGLTTGCKKIIVIASGGAKIKRTFFGKLRGLALLDLMICRACVPMQVIELDGDLGGGVSIIDHHNEAVMCGCAAAWLAGMMLAYIERTDAIWFEQDILAFGPWVERMYADLGGKQIVFGEGQPNEASTSLFLIKWKFIPAFIQLYLAEGPEDSTGRIPELKFKRIRERYPELCATLSFGVDRRRPLPYDDPVWYAHKLTPAELTELKTRKLITCGDIPQDVVRYSNHLEPSDGAAWCQ